MPRNLFIALLISTGLALLLSLVPEVGGDRPGEVETFQQAQPIYLDEQNLVDLFTLSATHYNIKRVKWDNRSLYVDFAVPSSQLVDEKLLLEDFYSLVYKTFTMTYNVEHFFFRLLEIDHRDTVRLLLAINAARPLDLTSLLPPEQIADLGRYIKQTFELRLDPELEQRFRP